MAFQKGDLIGKKFRFESKNYPNHFIRHQNWKVFKHANDSSELYQLDSSFDIIPGIAGQGVSLRSVNYPAYFIGHRNGNCLIRSSDGTRTFKEDVSWIPRPGLADPHAGVSFESVNYPGHYLRHRNTKQLRKDANDTSVAFKEESTWYPRPVSKDRANSSYGASIQNFHQALEEVKQKKIAALAKPQKTEEIEGVHKQLEFFKQMSMEEEKEKKKAAKLAQMNKRRAEEAEDEARELGNLWVVSRGDIKLTDEELGRGGWGKVMVADFRGIRVAAKCLYEELDSDYYRDLFSREMRMAARLRHPNLVQFIGASITGRPVILTELMQTSLRKELEKGPINQTQITCISLDVARALNYLHLMQPHPIIHRDISSANVLLNPLPGNHWVAKVSDYGSVNIQKQLCTENPGSPVYSPPEARIPALQSPKMDIFSFGVLLIEMLTGRFPEVEQRQRLMAFIEHPDYLNLIEQCISEKKEERPSAKEVITKLSDIKKACIPDNAQLFS